MTTPLPRRRHPLPPLRRTLLLGALAAPALALQRPARADGTQAAEQALRAGGVVLAMRHALAPGTFDPPEFRVGDCSTQRNLNDEGRAQARRIGAWFRERGLVPAAVRSSPWCRCQDTATLAFGSAQTWPALGSPRGADAATNARRLRELRQALAAAPAGRFEVWVTHNFVLADLAASGTDSGEGLVLRAAPGPAGGVQVVARLDIG